MKKATKRKGSLGNPLALATAAGAVEARANRKAVERANRTPEERTYELEKKRENRKIILALLGIGVGSYVAYTIVDNAQKAKAINQIGTDTIEGKAGAMAGRFYAAIIPSGKPWLNDWLGDGTDFPALKQLALEMGEQGIELGEVAKPYKALYNRELINDLQDMNENEYAEFMFILNQSRSSASASSSGLAQYGYIKTGERVNIYRTTNSVPIVGEYGVTTLTTLNGGQFIGTYTGIKTAEFMQFRTNIGVGTNKQTYLLFVESNKVNLVTVYDSTKGKTQSQIDEIIKNYK